ncbi:IMS domain-containing protein [Dolichospermum circinale]|uniref:IMS domain-containing protein n=1 Tax=Dolichospermum circinale TaxID=109265 RepID=UPI00232F6DA0|nr:IMS domain-containing protein [Dolichospermum circinale]MDB9454823.1 IMS domain-containing protein [Dolichospermum circinale CS-541/06]MDB9463618.1 IMS domain-containing protein [Dolichospermum circinale CS-541/04]MDB9549296.1 IMS domain-containing protein [Dolichospermum circinale CS-1031]
MRIPLDYYRILGLPLVATEEQLRQAYSDRIVQLPRREYSTTAISSRKDLISEAYMVLLDAKKRKSYDELYLSHIYTDNTTADQAPLSIPPTESNSQGLDPSTLSIEISPDRFIGSLLILQELGEYELVLKLGRPHLVNKPSKISVKTGNRLTQAEIPENLDLPDIILTVSLACLELGREEWQQGNYENAAISLETGEELLAREGLFPTVRAEMTADLYKLRPYRILELLALPKEQVAKRQQGLELLQSILEDRGGIDGSGNDQSGLNIDDFLRFIQQIRHFLTVSEQHKLFELESKRPSAVATYLAVYSLIARGFTQRQPALIRQAKQMLMQLAKRQDVHLEQSLCALLMGQTEEATRVLELSQEYEALAFIREKSQDSPDLLPGLCLYTEKWLQQEVFPHFRDLGKQKAALKDYFADKQVQAYLESLPTDVQTTERPVIHPQSFPQPDTNHFRHHARETGETHQYHHQPSNPELPETHHRHQPEPSRISMSRWNHTTTSGSVANQGSQIPVTPIGATSSSKSHPGNHTSQPATNHQHPRRRRRKPSANNIPQRFLQSQTNFLSSLDPKTRLVWMVSFSLGGVVVFSLLVSTTVELVKNIFFSHPSLQGEQLAIELNQPPITIPDPNGQSQPRDEELTNKTAKEVIETWLSAKAAALGENHDINGLNKILTGQVLLQWRSLAQQEQEDKRYRQYKHDVKVESVSKKGTDKNYVSVDATVQEVTQFYENSRQKKSSHENLRVRYELVHKEGKWLIQRMSVIQTFS